MKKLFLMLIAGVVMGSGCNSVGEHKQLKAFPEAKEGMERFVIELPHKDRSEEKDYKVELIPGKMMETDGVNTMRLGYSIKAQPLKGWGYTYYDVTGSDNAMSTMMAAPGGKRITKFVAGKPLLIRYNSRLPIVVYAPKGAEVKYRIWSANPDAISAGKE